MNNRVLKIGNAITIIAESGNMYTKTGADFDLYNQLLAVNSEDEIKQIMQPEFYAKQEKVKEEIKKVEKYKSNWDILLSTGYFKVEDDCVLLKGIDRTLPKLLIDKFIEVMEVWGASSDNGETLQQNTAFTSLVRFWQKCCLNPNARSAEDLYSFLEKHNMKIVL